jgi:ribosomal protein L11 methyltransferase
MKDSYHELKLTIAEEYLDIVLSYVMDLVNDAVEYTDKHIILRLEDGIENIEKNIHNYIKTLSESMDTTIDYLIDTQIKENIDWIQKYKDSIEPLAIGKFYIRPAWYEPKEELIDIIINPALAFGSGHHPTTNSCINFISKYTKPNDNVIDVGCGSGILSIAANKLGAIVDICDTDQQAIDSSIENFSLNNASINQSWTGSITTANNNKEYDIVIANIVADVLVFIAKDLQKACKSGGKIILSGILEKNKQKVMDKFKNSKLIDEFSDGEWVSLVYEK